MAIGPSRCPRPSAARALRKLDSRIRLRARTQVGRPRRRHRDLRCQRPDGDGDPPGFSRSGPGDPRRRIGRRLRRCSGGRVSDGAVDHGCGQRGEGGTTESGRAPPHDRRRRTTIRAGHPAGHRAHHSQIVWPSSPSPTPVRAHRTHVSTDSRCTQLGRTAMSATPFTRRKFLISTAAAASSAWFLAACSGGEPETPAAAPQSPKLVPQSDIDKAMDTATTLTFWTWVPDIQNEIKLFTTKYPKIKVNLVNVGQGAPHYQKLRTAIQAGQGAPDVAQVEFQFINSFTLGEGNLLDLTPYVPATLKDSYPEWVWSQVNTNGGLWGIPQDTGPMGLLYREDLLQQAGLQAPKTWDDFAAAAQTYHSKNSKSYLVNVAPNQPGQFVAYLWQAGVRPFTFDGQQTVKVDLANPEAQKIAKFWGDLVTSGTASNDADFNDTWYQGLSNGKYATLPIAAWGPVFLQGAAGKTSGKWRANTRPKGDPSNVVSSNWGGSTDAVLKLSKNQIAASQFALFLNTDKESALKFANEQYLFPAMKEILTDPSFVNQESKFYGGQKVNEKFAQISETVSPDFQWLPFMDYVYTNFNETLGKAFADKTDAVAGLQAWQDACANFAKDQGFTVACPSLGPWHYQRQAPSSYCLERGF